MLRYEPPKAALSLGNDAPSITLKRLTLFCAVCAFAAGSLVQLGWSSDVEILKRIHPGFVAMNPMTAACFILSGSSIALFHFGRRRTGAALALTVVLITLTKLLDIVGAGFPVDQLLFRDLLDAEPGSLPNRMAPNTAVALLFGGLSLALVGSEHRRTQLWAQALAIAVMLISVFALVGYLFAIDPLRGVGAFIPMALHTALVLLVVAVGALSLRPDKGLMLILRDEGPAGSMARVVLPLAVLIPIITGIVRLWGQRHGYYGTEAGVALFVMSNVTVTSTLLISSILGLYRSDCMRQEREQALSLSEHFNRTINEASPDCVSLLDLEGKVVFSNDAAVQAWGLTDASELIGRPWGSRLRESTTAEDRDAALAAAREGKVGRLTLSLPSSGGKRWFESLISQVQDADGQSIQFIVMSRDITQQKFIEDQVRWAATHDALTELPNRSLFQSRLEQLTKDPHQPGFALLVLDVDDFKQVNDTLGHDAGDALLSTVAQRLRKGIRTHDFVARLGGDEFAIILHGLTSEFGTVAAAEKILQGLREPWVYDGRLADCRVSAGASISPLHGREASTLLKNADIALYAAKFTGQGQIAVFRSEMREKMQQRSSKISLARRALETNLVVPFYQPKVELASGKVIGFEALLRWRHPDKGIQSPSTIDAAFEDLELAREITDQILGQAIADMRRWLDLGVPFGHVAVNASAADFKQEQFAERLLKRLKLASIPTRCVQVEVTETVFLGRGAEYVEKALKTLSSAGIRIALDDFGTGYASLSHLKQFPVDIVKIDRSFLVNVRKDARNAAIIRTVVGLGRSLDLEVVAEGVETADQAVYLMSQGCRIGQGYLYGTATAAAEVPRLLTPKVVKIATAA